jgi:hypothetical protein
MTPDHHLVAGCMSFVQQAQKKPAHRQLPFKAHHFASFLCF